MAFQDFYDDVQRLYIAYYQRPADPGGLRFWAQRLEAAGGSLEGIIDAFATSPEAVSLYDTNNDGRIDLSDASALIDRIYQALFNRLPDAAGKQFYLDALTNGQFPDGRPATPGRVALDILNGARNEDAVAIANKLDAATRFTNILDPDNDGLAPYQATYSGNADAAQARTFLAQVTSDPATVPTSAAITTFIRNNIADPGDPILSQPSGQTFVLTTNIDNLTGTSGDDTFIGDNNTASPADQITGGLGTDTLKLYGTTTKPAFSGVEQVYLNAPGGNFDVSGNSDVTSIEMDSETGSRTLTVTSGQAVKLTNVPGGQITTIAGNTPTSLDLTVNKAGTSTTDHTVAFSGTALTTLNVTASSNASYLTVTNAGGKLDTINISGDKDISLQHALTTVKTINAGSATGNVTIDGVGASNLTFTGGSGNDKIVMGATITGSDKLDGGAGDDTLSVSDADTIDSAAEVANIKNFEYFEAAAADGTTYDMSYLLTNNSLKGLIVSGAATVTVSNLTSTMASDISIVADTTTVLSSSDFVSGGTSDTATIKLGNTSQKVSDIVANLTFTNVDVINLVSNSDGTPTGIVGGAEENSITITATDLEKIVVTGDEAVVVTTAATSLPTEIDASGMTAAVKVDTSASAIASILVKGTAKNDIIKVDNAATTTTTLYLGGGTDTVTVDGGGTGSHTLIYTATALNSGDVKAGSASTVTLTGVAAGDVVYLNFGSAIEALLKNGGTVLGSSTANVNIHGTTLSATTNVAASQTGGNMVMQIDLNGDGAYNAADDWQITLVGTGTDDTLVYNAAGDYFVFTVV